MKNLKKLRNNIDKIDNQIISLLNERTSIAKSIGKLKKTTGKNLYSADRESKVLSRIKKLCKSPLTKENLESIYREIMSASLNTVKELKVSYLGPVGSFTHLASLKRFGSQVKHIPCVNISDIFVEVEKENTDYGVVPVENSTEGIVNYTLDMFIDSDLKICSQVTLDIAHNLLSKSSRNKIKRIYSNPQIFAQCRRWLEINLPKADLIDVTSSSKAAEIASKEKNSACIASILAAQCYKLKVLEKSIQDSGHNITRFFVIGKEEVSVTGKDKTSIMFSIKDRVGALYDMLSPFRKYNINLTKIESRPSKKKAWDYFFFLDLNGHITNPKVKKAVKELEKHCKFVKVLGSYPEG